jgi:Protein of unknown function (DUF4232)
MTAPSRKAGRALAGSALACFAALITGCGTSASPAAAPTTTVTVKATTGGTASTVATTAASAGSSPTSPAATAAPAGAAACPTRSLGAKPGLAQGAAGSTYQVIDFTNISKVTCTLYGFPGVSLAGGHPVTQIGLAAAEDHSSPRRLVTLAPGAVANAVLRIVHAANFPANKCLQQTSDYLQIYPPNQTTPIYLHYVAPGCSKPVPYLTVSVVQSGSGGG